MSNYVEFELEDGSTVVMEVADEAATGLVPASRDGEEMVQKAKKTFNEAVEHVRGAANLIVTKLRTLSDPPDEVEVTFGLKASGELGNIVVAKGSIEANYNVKLKWSRKKDDEDKKTQ